MEKFEKPKQERNLEGDKNSFIETISSVLVEEVPTIFDKQSIQELAESIGNTKLFILGEMHGVKENADVIYTLFKKFGFRQLALEWEPELKTVAERYLQSGELDFDAIKDSPDGRITAGHFALLKKLKSEGMLEGLVCFDGGSGGYGWNARDAAMAENILNNLSDVPTLVVAGNLHTKTEPITFDNEPDEQHPMGENIKRQIPGITSGRIEYLMGQYHNYGTKEFTKLSDEELPSMARFFKDEDGLYTFELVEAHAATVPSPSERI
ncbi:hypothetical protein IPH92_02370 [Candidatus Kaiserbacteria bacterium]|nr:MAG: hypothetical protein IPH92_02370 [Candidatus Kaiserbacteria bacterium]